MEPEVRLTKPSYTWADVLRVLAASMVILLHTAGTGVIAWTKLSTADWWICNLYDSAVRHCVPLFVMLSGALLLPSIRPLAEFLQKRAARILWPFLFWTLIYLIYNYFSQSTIEQGATPIAVAKWVYANLQQGAAFHFWYVYMILGVLAATPTLSRWVSGAPASEIRFFLGIWLLTLFSSIPLFSKYGIRVDLHFFAGYTGYFILGYYIAHRQPKTLLLDMRWSSRNGQREVLTSAAHARQKTS